MRIPSGCILQNDWTYWCGFGVFHSGVEVYGVEYAFGGAPGTCRGSWKRAAAPACCSSAAAGLCSARMPFVHALLTCMCSSLSPLPPSAMQHPPTRSLPFPGHEYDAPGVFATNPREAPGTVSWREAVPVGRTDLSPAEVHAVVQEMGQQYRGNRWAANVGLRVGRAGNQKAQDWARAGWPNKGGAEEIAVDAAPLMHAR